MRGRLSEADAVENEPCTAIDSCCLWVWWERVSRVIHSSREVWKVLPCIALRAPIYVVIMDTINGNVLIIDLLFRWSSLT